MNLELLFASHRERLLQCTSLPKVFAGRGLTLERLKAYELGLDSDSNGVIALRDPDRRLLGLKTRLLYPKSHKYLEIPSPNGNRPWCPAHVRHWSAQSSPCDLARSISRVADHDVEGVLAPIKHLSPSEKA